MHAASNHYFLCVGGIESAQHLSISCYYASSILDLLIRQDLEVEFDGAISWADLMEVLLTILDEVKRQVALLSIQVFSYHIWRERNARSHNKGIFHPMKLLAGIRVDIKSRLKAYLVFKNTLY